VRSERQVAAVLIAAGAKDIELPDPAAARQKLDAELNEIRQPISPSRRVLLEALGVTRGR